MDNATMLYRPGGDTDIHGFMLSYVVVDADAVPTLLEAGWFLTPTEAGQSAPVVVPAPAAINAPPTRDEMEQKADELGLKYDGRTSDKRLAVMIADALRG